VGKALEDQGEDKTSREGGADGDLGSLLDDLSGRLADRRL
jgi:hypothetical protein